MTMWIARAASALCGPGGRTIVHAATLGMSLVAAVSLVATPSGRPAAAAPSGRPAARLQQPAPPPDPPAAVATAEAAARARLRALHEQAETAARRGDDATTSVANRRDALAETARALDALAAHPELPPDLRTALAGAGSQLATLLERLPGDATSDALDSTRAEAGLDAPMLNGLLARVARALADDTTHGLTLQGSFSQTRTTREPATGGHASAMGPAPASAPAASAVTTSPVQFEETATLPTRTWAGGPTKDHILESAGTGVALFDYDNDGWLDIYLVTAPQLSPTRQRVPHRNALYRNLGGWRFEDVTTRAGVDLAAWGNGACVGDVDGDGLLDLYVTNWGPDVLFRNKGDGTFEDATSYAGIAAAGWSTGCAFLDADADGDLDLYVARYVRTTWDELVNARRTLIWRDGPRIMVGPAGLPGESDLFFENVGNGRFRDATAARGLEDAAGGYGFAVVTADFDDDAHVDLFVANDSTPNFLYRNLGHGHFDSVGLLAGVAVNGEARAQAGMGADAGDVDGDGRLDIVLTAFAHDRNTIYRNLGDGLFEDATVTLGLAAPTFVRMGWGAVFLDADLDGHLDLFIANGHIFADVDDFPALGESFAQKNQFLRNDGGRAFVDVSDTAGAGLQVRKVSRGLAAGDLDNDGDLDVVVSNMDDVPTLLENRQRTGHRWLGVRLSMPAGNRFAIGARIEVEAQGRMQVREVRSGGSYLSQSDLRAFFGLGPDARAATVSIRMPGGARWRWNDLPVDRLHDLTLTPNTRVADGVRSR